jgi:hypothetical protein
MQWPTRTGLLVDCSKRELQPAVPAAEALNKRFNAAPQTADYFISRLVRASIEVLWLAAAIALNLLFTARTMAPAFRRADVVQDDARQHVFWMARFRDPELFPDDFIADYYQALAPPGYAALYWALSWVVDPLLASKLLPPLLGVLVVLFTFLLVRRLHPQPAAAFFASGLLSWYLWQLDDLSSGTPRAFGPPLVAAQAWACATGRLALTMVLVVLSATFYPVAGALGVALLGMSLLRLSWRPTLVRERSAWLAFGAAAVAVAIVVLSGQLALSRFSPVVSASQAQAMPEFQPNGHNAFFVNDAFSYWIRNSRSGLDLRLADSRAGRPVLLGSVVLAALLPLLLVFGQRLPADARVRDGTVILVQLTVGCLGLFMLAHLLLFRLYYPGRYPKGVLPLVVAVAAGLVLGILITVISRWVSSCLTTLAPGRRDIRRRPFAPEADRGAAVARCCGGLRGERLIASGLSLALGAWLAAYPAINQGLFRNDEHPIVTSYLRALPKDVVVASLPRDSNGVPIFARRTVLASHQFALALHQGYYAEIRQRIDDLIEAYYADSLPDIVDFAIRYDVDVFLVNRAAFRESTFADAWTGEANGRWEPFTPVAARKLKGQERFALLDVTRRCASVDDRVVAAVTTDCLRGEAERAAASASG